MALPTPQVGLRRFVPALVVLVFGHVALILSRSYLPGGDWAFVELRTADVFSANSPLTGAWSRYGWNHPGPFLYDALALPRLLTGGSWRGLWLGAMLLNLAAIGTAAWVVRPRGTLVASVWTVAACWTIAAGTPHLVTDPWNASVVILPVLTVAAAVVAVRGADRRGVAVAVVLTVLVAQTHAAYGVLLVPSLAVVLVIGWRRWRRWTLAWSGVGALLCLPIVVDTLVNWPGNLWRAFRFTATSDEPSVGLGQVARLLGRAASLSFFTSPRTPSFAAVVGDTPWGVAPFAALVLAALAWWGARRAGLAVWCHALEAVSLAWLGGALMTWRTRGPLLVWLTTWTVAVAALTWCVVVAVAAKLLLARPEVVRRLGTVADHRRAAGAAAVATGSAALVFAVVNVAGSMGEPYPFQEFTPVVEQFADAALPLVDDPTLVDLAGPEYEAGAVQSALIARLDDAGGRPLGRPDQALQLGDHRTSDSIDGRRLLVQVEPRTARPAGAEQVSTWDPLTATERSEADRLVDELSDLLTEVGLPDRVALLANAQAPLAALDGPEPVIARRADFERLGELHARGPRVVLYLVEP